MATQPLPHEHTARRGHLESHGAVVVPTHSIVFLATLPIQSAQSTTLSVSNIQVARAVQSIECDSTTNHAVAPHPRTFPMPC